jgi:hypothetical protein
MTPWLAKRGWTMTGRRVVLVGLALVLACACRPSPGETDPEPDGGGSTCAAAGVPDRDGDGVSDADEGDGAVDTDLDGAPDSSDDDSDGDGRTDAAESGRGACEEPQVDSDDDGTPDLRDADSDENGIADDEELDDDPDDDGVESWRDVDDDGDGIGDAAEIGDRPSEPADTDADGVPDYRDLDSDSDLIPDSIEGDDDRDGDGLGAYRDDDADGDGWSDADERGSAAGEPPVDTDGDGVDDFLDDDSDGDHLGDDAERDHETSRTDADTDGDGFTDYQEVQQETDPLDASEYPRPDPCEPAECQPAELCGEAGSGDGLDNDCNGEIDEGCPCSPGETRPCFAGRPSERGQGVCTDGLLTCDEFGLWTDCAGGVFAQTEACDGADNDCDGLFDEDLPGCESPLDCPGTTVAAPLSTVALDGARIYDGVYDSWTWEVFCPMTVESCPVPDDPASRDTSVYVIQSGAYHVRATIVIEGETFTCEQTIEVKGDGLRVELLWDTQGYGRGNTDVDLHLHRPGTETDWFDDTDDCYFVNCKSDAHPSDAADWGYEDTAETEVCDEAPHGHGSEWESLGYCANPRLDVDVILCDEEETDSRSIEFCAPENINMDNPAPGDTFRIMVNYWSAHDFDGVTHPTVNVYCGGALRASFGAGGAAAELVTPGGLNPEADSWLVADVQFLVDECGVMDCRIAPIVDEEGRPWVQQGAAFGPPWSY